MPNYPITPFTCDGETFLGFTVRRCDFPATRTLRQDANEVYHFCAAHYLFAVGRIDRAQLAARLRERGAE